MEKETILINGIEYHIATNIDEAVNDLIVSGMAVTNSNTFKDTQIAKKIANQLIIDALKDKTPNEK